MSVQKTIVSIEQQIAALKTQKDECLAAYREYTQEADAEFQKLHRAEMALRQRLYECTRIEIKWLKSQTAALRQRRFEHEILEGSEKIVMKQSSRQRLTEKLAKKNTSRAVE